MKSKSNLAKRIISLICLVAVITAFLCSCSIFKSKEDLLTSEEWYRVYSSYNDSKYCEVIHFYSNGHFESNKYRYRDEKWCLINDDQNSDWELLDDNTLVYGKYYYDWDDEWKVDSDTLIMPKYSYGEIVGSYVYTHDNPGIDD